MKTFSKGSFARFFPKNGPGGGGGTNYLHTTLLKPYPKSNFLDSRSMFFGFSAPKIGGGGSRKHFQRLIYPFFSQKWPPGGGGGRFTRFHQTWH